MGSKKIVIYKKDIWVFVLFVGIAFLFFPPMIISISPSHDLFNNIVRITAGLVSVLEMVKFIMTKMEDKPFYPIIVFVFFALLEISNLVNGYAFNRTLSFVLSGISTVGLTCFIINTIRKNRLENFLNAFIVYGVVLTISNLLTQFFHYGQGLYNDFRYSWQPYYLCGNANAFVFFYTIVLAVIYMQALKRRNYKLKLLGFFVNICMIVSTALGPSTTGTVCLVLMLVLNMVSDTRLVQFVMRHGRIILMMFFAFVIWFIVLRGWNEEFVRSLIENVVHEGRNLLSRGEIWDYTIRKIQLSPIWGYGSIDPRLSFSRTAGTRITAHNSYLQMMLYGGMVAFVLYFVLVYIAIRKNAMSDKREKAPCLLALFIFLLSYVFEQNPFYIGFYLLLVLMYVQGMESIRETELA